MTDPIAITQALDPTPDELRLAREIADNSAYIRDSHTWWVRMRGALAAIRETTERAAELANSYDAELAGKIADDLRNGEHLQ